MIYDDQLRFTFRLPPTRGVEYDVAAAIGMIGTTTTFVGASSMGLPDGLHECVDAKIEDGALVVTWQLVR